MTIERIIDKYNYMAKAYVQTAVSKAFYNEQAAEEDRALAEEYRQIAEWLTELKEIKDNEPRDRMHSLVEKMFRGMEEASDG